MDWYAEEKRWVFKDCHTDADCLGEEHPPQGRIHANTTRRALERR